MAIPTRILGRTEQRVTMLGLGGEGVLRTFGQEKDAVALVNRALDLGSPTANRRAPTREARPITGRRSGSGARRSSLPANPTAATKRARWPICMTLSQPVTNVVIGCDTIAQLEQNVGFAGSFEPMTPEEQQDLIRDVSPFARQLMYYKP